MADLGIEDENSLVREVKRMRVADLRAYYRNPRRGDIPAITESMRVNKSYKPLVVNIGTHTGRPYEVLAGNHSLAAMRDLGWDSALVALVDVDEDHGRRIMLADNRTGDKATYDVDLLTAEIQALEDLEGTGYTQADLDKLLYEDEEEDPADSEHEEQYSNRFELVVECADEDQQRDLYQRFTDEGLKVRVLSL